MHSTSGLGTNLGCRDQQIPDVPLQPRLPLQERTNPSPLRRSRTFQLAGSGSAFAPRAMGCTEPPRPVSKSGSHGCVELGCRMRRGRRSENGRDCIRQWTTRKLRTDWTDGSGTSGKIGRWRAEKSNIAAPQWPVRRSTTACRF